jgi:hypothetical protein
LTGCGRSEPKASDPGTTVAAHLNAGLAALDAGAADAAIAGLRQAVAAAREAGATDLHATSLLALGSALVHAVRGRDGEGAGVLHGAIPVAEEVSVAHGSCPSASRSVWRSASGI